MFVTPFSYRRSQNRDGWDDFKATVAKIQEKVEVVEVLSGGLKWNVHCVEVNSSENVNHLKLKLILLMGMFSP